MTRLTTDFSRIFACAPLNVTAAVVAGGAARKDSLPDRETDTHWLAPPMVRPVPRGVADLAGRRFGRLTVKGMLCTDGDASWVVRCACGDYEARDTDAVLQADPDERCAPCAVLDALRHASHVSSYGMRVADAMRRAERRARAEPGARHPVPSFRGRAAQRH